jgi:apolipoprotein D and lipocalin family protein
MKLVTALCAALLLTAPALARDSAPQPTKPVAMSFFSGRWYEIARTENVNQRGCEAPTYDFRPQKTDATRAFVLTCRKGSPTGKVETLAVTIRMPADQMRNKFLVTAMGGVMRQEYWVLDRADDLSWSIMATPGGNYVWLLARSPNLDEGLKTQLMNRIRTLGYDMGKIVQPKHA